MMSTKFSGFLTPLSVFLEPPLTCRHHIWPHPPSGTSSPAYSTSRLLGKQGKPGQNELTRKSVEQNQFILETFRNRQHKTKESLRTIENIIN